MKVMATKTEYVEVDVKPLDAFTALKRHLFHARGIPFGAYIKDGKIVVDQEYHTSHSWFEEKVMAAEPSKDQLEVISTMKSLAALIDKT
jgi:hypothetical protein